LDVERTILGKAILAGQLDELVAAGIEPEHFSSRECTEVYESCLAHYRRYQVPPSREAVAQKHPDFHAPLSQDSTEFLIDQFVQKVKRREAIRLGEAYMEAIDDPDEVGHIEDVAMEMAATLMEVVPQPRVGLYSDAELRIADYIQRRDEERVWGLKMGVPTLDNLTMGLQPKELAVVVAWQGVGKSLFMQHWCWQMYEQGKRPLFISLEMSKEELYERWDTMATSVLHHALRACELDETDMDRWREVAKKAKDARAERDIIAIDDLHVCTPDRVLAETRRYKPDAVFVDYLELMDPPRRLDGGWQEINIIGKDLKRNARVLGTPVIVAAQTNVGDGGTGPTLANISYKSTGKHANIIVGIHRDEEMEAADLAEVRLLKSRNGPRGRAEMHWNAPRMDFREKNFNEYVRMRSRPG
jgi:replicative DNA helicase